jgi:hypothetical protein
VVSRLAFGVYENMLKRWFKKLVWQADKQAFVDSKREMYGLSNLDDDAIGYPPNPIGIPVVQPHVLLERMQGQINAIRNEIGVSKEVFNEYIYPVFESFIRYADLLPASEYKHHATGGGLVSHSLDVAHRSMRAAQMTHFPVTVGSLTETQQSNIQWRTGTILAGLLHDAGKILADVQVHDGNAKTSERVIWDAQSGTTIHAWAAEHQIERYFITWNRDRHMKHQNASLVMMERLIPAKTWSWLEKCYDGKHIHSMMLASVGKTNMSHPMPQIIAEADSASTKADMFSRNSHITKEIKRVPLSELLCDLIRHYILIGKWKVNEKSAYLWFVEEQLYVIWNNAVPELVEEMVNAGYNIPSVPEVLARIMVEEGQVTSNGDELYFDIYPEILGDAKKPVKVKGLKFRNVQRLVLEPEKLYSLKEHSKRPKVAKPVQEKVDEPQPKEQVVPDSEIIEEIFDEPTDYTVSGNMHKQKTHETSKETLGRVLKNISKSLTLKAVERKPSAPVSKQKHDAPKEIEVPSYTKQHESEFVDADSSSNTPDEATDNVSTEHSELNEQPELSTNESPSIVSFTTPIAQFIAKHYDYEVQEQRIQVPNDAVMDIVMKAELELKNVSMLDLFDSPEIVIND